VGDGSSASDSESSTELELQVVASLAVDVVPLARRLSPPAWGFALAIKFRVASPYGGIMIFHHQPAPPPLPQPTSRPHQLPSSAACATTIHSATVAALPSLPWPLRSGLHEPSSHSPSRFSVVFIFLMVGRVPGPSHRGLGEQKSASDGHRSYQNHTNTLLHTHTKHPRHTPPSSPNTT
jgi:hypothetical protein